MSNACTSRPIVFYEPMVRAILAGTKTQTRRLINPRLAEAEQFVARCPYGGPGDQLWVQESWAHDHNSLEDLRVEVESADGGGILGHGPYYRADVVHKGSGLRWRPSTHMPRWASRITLEITSVNVARLQDISGDDARREGVSAGRCACEVCLRSSRMCPADESAHVLEFSELWDSLNRKRAPWSSNPWVWVIAFMRVESELPHG